MDVYAYFTVRGLGEASKKAYTMFVIEKIVWPRSGKFLFPQRTIASNIFERICRFFATVSSCSEESEDPIL